ncbi:MULTISPECIES: phosphomannomutase/phosphoglucomutase [Nitrosomonas]|uniref:Phosphoglucomutase and phosphomannomutase family n=1 Tax=Nitrosomonas europaea (strain ATCC 19718 / CIP 103999 / KCTC 2705 / NBRC 14298) TaxID=228410 RepID=Q82TJ2_NITEU|nr:MULTISPECIES: phosphomannomutase/phosphoglucomutase [Nitrosomonas]CAD85806.1 Phosphoglucomutase and phosphomannomutase family [Nitrosomonas europaea ATCC 19718]SDW57239.1 phosphomannomutase [Nitrosomonas europaea]SET18193.1 phosphomannomutase [Nitrosomonas europaea]SJZ66840.1 phosphomannomutase [Nitrosomonas europaea]HBF24794.1 phosphomannomutase/phosphoglucomutase [Nitrosomonas sp.]
MSNIAPEIFKAYDIRGIVETALTPATVELIGHAIGSEARERQLTTIAIGRDGRLSGPELAQALTNGIRKSGIDVIDVGMVPTPVLYYAAHELCGYSGVMVTGSHNPPEYNGLKIVLGGETLAAEAIQSLRLRIEQANFQHGQGSYRQHDIVQSYLQRIIADVKLARPVKIVVDCGNGVTGVLAPELYRRLGCEVIELFCEVDGTFPNHHPDPSVPENLQDVIRTLATTDAEIGFAFDGDGDRLGVVTKDGSIIYPDRQLMLFAADVLSRNPGGQIIYDVKCTRTLAPWIIRHGGKPVMWKTGHSFIKAKLKETGALLAGEMSGHIFFKERWYGFDDGLYAGTRLLELLSKQVDPATVLHALPDTINTPELQIKLKEGENHALIAQLQRDADFPEADQVITIDGLRVEYKDGFGLIRASNTTPVAVLRFEADNRAALERIQQDFRRVILQARPDAALPF